MPALETQRILNYFNQFATSTVQMLNKFAVLCDTRLLQLDFKLQDVEATLAILEAKVYTHNQQCLFHIFANLFFSEV